MKLKLANQRPSKKELDALARQVVFARAKGKCERCYSMRNLQLAHFITRGNHAVRWEVENNLFCLCAGCHTMRNDSFHKSPVEASEWVKHRIGEAKYEVLRMRACSKCGDKQLIKIDLENQLKYYEEMK